MLLTSYFLLNLFCGFFSCDYNHDISSTMARNGGGVLERRRAAISIPIIVVTHSGTIEGFTVRTLKQREIYAFEGIPYGEAPVGDLRFKSPKPKLPWKGILETKSPGSYCAQLNFGKIPQIMGKEDCLFLNIYTIKIHTIDNTDNQLIPVIVYFHGGAFTIGAGHETGPAYLLDHDVVLVTVNYRLGVLGFLSTLDESSPGNYGLKDQALALKWVHENIVKFGGNNSLVTLFGSSAGAASVHLHMLSNKTRDYFSAGVSSSGTAFNPWVIQPPGLINNTNNKLAKLTRCSQANTKAFVNCLRKINVYRLVGKQNSIYEWYQLPAVIFGPVIEPPNPDAFLTESPEEIYRQNATAAYPWISTLAQDECEGFIMLLDTFRIIGSVRKRWTNMSSLILDYKYRENVERARELTTKVSDYYFGKEVPTYAEGQTIGQLWSDRYFNFPTHEAVVAHSKIAPTYSGIFGYKGPSSVAGYLHLNRDKWGIAHGEDEFYYFNRTMNFPAFKTTDVGYAIVKFMTSTITNFAKTREPLYNDGVGNTVRVWEPVDNTKNIIRSLYINNEIRMIEEPHRQKFKFWKSLNMT